MTFQSFCIGHSAEAALSLSSESEGGVMLINRWLAVISKICDYFYHDMHIGGDNNLKPKKRIIQKRYLNSWGLCYSRLSRDVKPE